MRSVGKAPLGRLLEGPLSWPFQRKSWSFATGRQSSDLDSHGQKKIRVGLVGIRQLSGNERSFSCLSALRVVGAG